MQRQGAVPTPGTKTKRKVVVIIAPKAKKSKTEIWENAVIYARYSSSGQREESIEGQLRDCRQYAEALGVNVIGEYCDKALTGTMDKRPEFQRMIRDSAKKQFTVLICWKNDRFARNKYDAVIYKSRLKANGVKILYAKETIPEGPEGIILESILEGYAEYYSANLSQNVKRGNRESAMKLQTVGQVVFGLRAGADKRFEHDPQTAPIVKRIFEEYAAGKKAKDIIADLNAEGFRTVTGGKFNANSINRILQNEKYIGVYEYSGVRDEHGIPPIVSRELFEKCAKMVKKRHEAPAAKREAGGFLLTGKLFCGECGSAMTGDCGTGKSGKVYAYYTCVDRRKQKKCAKERAPKEWAENVVVSELVKIVHNDEVIQAFADRFMEWQKAESEAPNEFLSGMEQQLRQTETAIKNNLALIDSGVITDSVRSHLMELEIKRDALERGIATERLAHEAPKLSRESVVWFLEQFRIGNADDPEWRIYLVDTFLKAAYLYDDGRLLLHLNFTGDKSKVSLQLAEEAVQNGEVLCSISESPAVP